MDSFTVAFNFFLIVIFILLNGFFVSAEFTIVKVRLSQLEELIANGNKRAEYAKKLVDQMDVSLSVTQLGITLVSLALGCLTLNLGCSLLLTLYKKSMMKKAKAKA